MDEWTLNDLLECSVCLERLDTSSKVLPCQHTFCRKCLEEILSTHKELRCPECRVLVDSQIDELPPNVLLMRILEGIKNSGNPVPKKKTNTLQKHQITSPQAATHPLINNVDITKSQSPKQNALPTQPFARALCDYISKEPGDLSFRKGEIILLHKKIDAQRYQGECGGKIGIFPSFYVQVIIQLPNQVATCRALYDFRMVNDEDEGCLSFRKDEIITVIRRVDENWAEGVLNNQIGIFPLAFVEMNKIAQVLMKLSINNQPGPSRVAPPTPTTEESSPLIPTEHSGVLSNGVNKHSSRQTESSGVSHQNTTPRVPVTTSVVISGTESNSTLSSTSTPSSSSITPNSSSNTSSTSNSAPNSPPSSQPSHSQNPFLPVTPSPRQMILQTSHITNSHGVLPTSHIIGQQSTGGSETFVDTHFMWTPAQSGELASFGPKEKRHSFSAVTPNPHNCVNSNKHSSEIPNSESATNNENGQLNRQGSQRHRRSGSDMSSSINLPVGYVALYSYKPQNADELELTKGASYLVTERCQDGWFKGISSKTHRSGVFPGNYVTLAKPVGTVQGQPRGTISREAPTAAYLPKPVIQQKTLKVSKKCGRLLVPPELPPRASSPSARHRTSTFSNSSTSWHPLQNDASNPNKNVSEASAVSPQPSTASALPGERISPVPNPYTSTPSKSAEKGKEKKEKSGLIKRLTTMKKSKSPPPTASYSMDNPVFDDNLAASVKAPSHQHPVHLRSGSCPSQLIQLKPEGSSSNTRTATASASVRLKQKERSSVSNATFKTSTSRPLETNSLARAAYSSSSGHRKTNSLDADARKPKQLVPPVRERFRCIVPYPPNSEYELELKVGDIIYVHKKREDGWYKGTQQRTGRTGLFPASFVETY